MLVNLSIQVVPIAEKEAALKAIDKVILIIQNSGLKYQIGALDTTVEGDYKEVKQLIADIENCCNGLKDTEFLINTKMHLCGGSDITIQSKTGKFYQDSGLGL